MSSSFTPKVKMSTASSTGSTLESMNSPADATSSTSTMSSVASSIISSPLNMIRNFTNFANRGSPGSVFNSPNSPKSVNRWGKRQKSSSPSISAAAEKENSVPAVAAETEFPSSAVKGDAAADDDKKNNYSAIAELDAELDEEKWRDRAAIITKLDHENYENYASEVLQEIVKDAIKTPEKDVNPSMVEHRGRVSTATDSNDSNDSICTEDFKSAEASFSSEAGDMLPIPNVTAPKTPGGMADMLSALETLTIEENDQMRQMRDDEDVVINREEEVKTPTNKDHVQKEEEVEIVAQKTLKLDESDLAMEVGSPRVMSNNDESVTPVNNNSFDETEEEASKVTLLPDLVKTADKNSTKIMSSDEEKDIIITIDDTSKSTSPSKPTTTTTTPTKLISPVVKDSTPEFEAEEERILQLEESAADVEDTSRLDLEQPLDLSLSFHQQSHPERPRDPFDSPIVSVMKRSEKEVQMRNMLLMQEQLLDKDKQIVELKKSIQSKEVEMRKVSESEANMADITMGFEQTVKELIEARDRDRAVFEIERERFVGENEVILNDLRAVERSFNDVHRKNERLKDVVSNYKRHEDALTAELSDLTGKLRAKEERFELLRAHAEGKINDANKRLEMMSKARSLEVVKLEAMLKKEETKLKSLEVALVEKERENTELSKICDELIAKVEGAK